MLQNPPENLFSNASESPQKIYFLMLQNPLENFIGNRKPILSFLQKSQTTISAPASGSM